MNRIKKGDTVVVISGNDKSRQGKVLRILKKENCAIVENVRMLKNFTKADPQKGTTGGVTPQESPIPLSNLMLYNPTTKKPDKVSIKIIDNKKVRCFRSNGERIDLV